jgi:hypothetical protein
LPSAPDGNNAFQVGFNTGYGATPIQATMLSDGTLQLFKTANTRVTNADMLDASEIRISGSYETDD